MATFVFGVFDKLVPLNLLSVEFISLVWLSPNCKIAKQSTVPY